MCDILYVEDNEINRIVVNGYLQNRYYLEFAENSAQAIDRVRSRQFGLILMDIHLGPNEPNGVELMHLFKKEMALRSTPFLAVSAFADEEDKQHLLEQGFDDFHPKPVDKAILLQQIQRLCAL